MQPVEGAGRARAAMGVHVVYAVAGARGYSRVAQSPQLLSLLGRQGNGSRVAGDEKRNWMSCLPPTSAPGGMESRILAVHQDSNGQGRLGGLEIDHELVRFVAWVEVELDFRVPAEPPHPRVIALSFCVRPARGEVWAGNGGAQIRRGAIPPRAPDRRRRRARAR